MNLRLQFVPEIMIIDDSNLDRMSLEQDLLDQNFNVHSFSSAEKALKHLEYHSVDIILLDYRMSGIDGQKCLEEIRKKHSPLELPVIMITGISDNSKIIKLFEAGANDFIAKPLNFPVALARISGLLQIKKSNALVKQAQEKAEEAAKVKGQFLSNMSHEIRTPMNCIMGIAQLLMESDLEEEYKKNVEMIFNATENLLILVNDILDLSKLESKKIILRNEKFDFNKFLHNLEKLMKNQFEKKNLQFELNISEKIPPEIYGDPLKIQQILLNLLGNAIKFTDQGSVRLNVYTSEDEKYLFFEVIDTGIGIPKDKLDIIFNNFEQIPALTSERKVGTGLGLAICKNLVELMKGKIEVKSELNQGSSFIFSIEYQQIN